MQGRAIAVNVTGGDIVEPCFEAEDGESIIVHVGFGGSPGAI